VRGAGMVAPLGMAMASTLLARKRFSALERNNGASAWLLGAAFISEGAIPFAAADPLRVIPASVVGSGVAGAILMGAGVTSQAPHGGVFVFFAIGNFGMFLVAVLLGALVTALVLIALKRWAVKKPVAETADDKAVPVPA
jgi:PTS system fructose-specific IIC component